MAWHYKITSASKTQGYPAFESNHLKAVEDMEDFINENGPNPDGIKCVVIESRDARNFHCWVRADKVNRHYDLTHVVWTGNPASDTVIELLQQGAILCGFDLGGVRPDWTSGNQSLHYIREVKP